jgi:hypothetical protein
VIGFVVGLWKRIPVKVRLAIAGVLALLLAGLRIFFIGRRRGRDEASAEAGMTVARERADEVRDLADAGDDAEVQKRLAASALKAAKTTGRN